MADGILTVLGSSKLLRDIYSYSGLRHEVESGWRVIEDPKKRPGLDVYNPDKTGVPKNDVGVFISVIEAAKGPTTQPGPDHGPGHPPGEPAPGPGPGPIGGHLTVDPLTGHVTVDPLTGTLNVNPVTGTLNVNPMTGTVNHLHNMPNVVQHVHTGNVTHTMDYGDGFPNIGFDTPTFNWPRIGITQEGPFRFEPVTGRLQIEQGQIKVEPLTGQVTLVVPTAMPDVKMVYEGPGEIIHRVIGEDIKLKYDGPTEFKHRFEDTEFTMNYKGPTEFTLKTGNININIPDLYKKLCENAESYGYEKGRGDALLYALNKENAVHAIGAYLSEAFEVMRDNPEYVSDLARKTAEALPKILKDVAVNFGIYRGGNP